MCLVPLPGGHGTGDKPSARKKRSRGCILPRSTKNEGAILPSFAVRALDYPGHRWVRPSDSNDFAPPRRLAVCGDEQGAFGTLSLRQKSTTGSPHRALTDGSVG